MSTEPDDLDAFLAEKSTDPAFTQHWEALQATDRPATTDQTTQVHGPTPVERARSVVTDTIAAARIRGDGPWTTADAVLTALEREGYTVAPKVAFPHKGMSVTEASEWWERWIAAARASEPNRKCPLGLRHVNCSCAEPEQPWDEAGCSRSCRNGHTRRWGACAYGKEPAPTLHRFETGVAADGYVSGGHEPMTAEQVAEWLRVQGYAVAPRASEAPGDDGRPTPDVGAAQGGEGGSAAESEPRVHYEVEMYNDGWSIPIYRTDSVDDARAHEEPAVTSASTRIVRVTREVIQ